MILEYAAKGELYKELQKCKHFSEIRAAKVLTEAVRVSPQDRSHFNHKDFTTKSLKNLALKTHTHTMFQHKARKVKNGSDALIRRWTRNLLLKQLLFAGHYGTIGIVYWRVKRPPQQWQLHSLRNLTGWCGMHVVRIKILNLEILLKLNGHPPPSQWIKMNFDGAIFANQGESGIGILAWDSSGICIASAQRRMEGNLGAKNVEAVAAKLAVKIAIEFGWKFVIFEGDCLSIIHEIINLQITEANHANLIANIHRYTHHRSGFIFRWICREANEEAHMLARNAATDLNWSDVSLFPINDG